MVGAGAGVGTFESDCSPFNNFERLKMFFSVMTCRWQEMV
jgi:hypothetical protein